MKQFKSQTHLIQDNSGQSVNQPVKSVTRAHVEVAG